MKGQLIENKIYAIPIVKDRTVVFDIATGALFTSEKSISEISSDDVYQFDLSKISNVFPREVKQDLYKVSIASAESCNLRCKYCYAESGTYGNDKHRVMSFETYKKMFAEILELIPEGPGAICFFGGEPLLDFDAIKQFVLYVKELHKSRDLRLPIWEMVTNGTLLDEEKIIFLKDNNFQVNISLDGPKDINDLSRVFPDEKLSVFDSVKNNMAKVVQYGFEVSCGATLDVPFFMQYQEGQYTSYLESLYTLGFRYVGTNIASAQSTDQISTEAAKKIEMFARDMTDHDFNILENGGNLSRVSNLVLTIINRLTTRKYEVGCTPGVNNVFYTGDGKYYPCHLMYESRKKEFDYNDMKNGLMVESFDRNTLEPCCSCHCKNLCMFWCPAMFPVNNDHPNHSTCLFQKALFEFVAVKLVNAMGNEENVDKFVKNVKSASEIAKRYDIKE